MGNGKKNKDDEIDWSVYPEETTEIPNPNFYFGQNTFRLPNGDVYIGQFCAHKIGIAWREGCGIYRTKDSHIYEGIWENDKLLNSEDTKIQYPDGTIYHGPVINSQYNGSATYYLPNGLPISCTLEENHPVGLVVLTDPQNRLWKGTVDEDHVILLPENHFFENLTYDRGIGKRVPIKQSESDELINAKTIPSDATCLKDLQEIAFRKSKKTLNSVNSAYETSIGEETASLEVNCNRNVKHKTSARPSTNVSLLRTFLSKEFRSKCSPYYLLEPTVDMERKGQ